MTHMKPGRALNKPNDTTMALPKGKLMALLAVFAAIGIVTATGAFTTVTADRTATANVAGDASALLALQPYDGPNGDGEANVGGIASSESTGNSAGYAGLNGDTLEINLGGFGSSIAGSGVNNNAVTTIEKVFVITNQGTQPAAVSVNDADDDNQDTAVVFYNGTFGNSKDNGGLETNEGGQAVVLGTGESLVVHIEVDTNNVNPSDGLIDGDITVSAEAGDTAINSAGSGPGGDKS